MRVLVRTTTVRDVLVDAEYGDDDETIINRAGEAKTVEEATTSVVVASEPDLLSAKEFEDATRPEQPAYAGTGIWNVAEMDDLSYEKAKRETPDDPSVAAYKKTKGKK